MLSFHNKIHISFNYKWCLISEYFSSGSNNITFTEESNIMDLYFSQKQKFEVKNFLYMDLFITKIHLFASQGINWWTGVVWIIVMFLSAVSTLILTAPIHCNGSIG